MWVIALERFRNKLAEKLTKLESKLEREQVRLDAIVEEKKKDVALKMLVIDSLSQRVSQFEDRKQSGQRLTLSESELYRLSQLQLSKARAMLRKAEVRLEKARENRDLKISKMQIEIDEIR